MTTRVTAIARRPWISGRKPREPVSSALLALPAPRAMPAPSALTAPRARSGVVIAFLLLVASVVLAANSLTYRGPNMIAPSRRALRRTVSGRGPGDARSYPILWIGYETSSYPVTIRHPPRPVARPCPAAHGVWFLTLRPRCPA